MIAWLRPSSAYQHFDQVVRAYSSELFQYASWLCRDRHRAEDILQDAFARAWKSWDQVTEEASRRSWLYTIVRNEFLRDRGRHGATTAVELENDDDSDAALDIADEIDFTRGIELRDLLTHLPEKFLEPLLLQNLMGMSCEEIADVMGVSVNAAMVRLTRARQALHALVRTDDTTSNGNTQDKSPARLKLVQSGGAQ